MYGMRVHAFCIMSNHYHLLVTARDALQLARFMNFVQSNLAREAGRLARWKERFWSRRYQAILVSDEPAAQLSRLRYILAQGCKEGLVRRPELWRGAHCVRELIGGTTTLSGDWVDRTALYRVSGRAGSPSKFTTTEVLVLSPLACFEGWSISEQRDWVRRCVDEIASRARVECAGSSRHVGRRGRRGGGRHPRTPQPLRRSAAPWFHVSSAAAAFKLRVSYAVFVIAFRYAADKLRRGETASFPEGCFPPARPYVAA
jgi:hypothetical protein